MKKRRIRQEPTEPRPKRERGGFRRKSTGFPKKSPRPRIRAWCSDGWHGQARRTLVRNRKFHDGGLVRATRFFISLWITGIFATPGVRADGSQKTATQPAAVITQPVLLFPTQGRPAFVNPGGTLRIVAQIPPDQLNEAVCGFFLVSPRFPTHQHKLPTPPDAREKLAGGLPQTLIVPEHIPEQTYDLEIRAGAARLLGRHCVAVRRDLARLRLVHLSNMNVGEIGAPAFDPRLIDEINLVAPALIVATGDYLDAVHDDPPRGWRELTDFFARFDAPALLACGDHDDLDLYSRHLAPNPLGSVEVGRYRGIVLFDHPTRPIEEDSAQVRWVERLLAAPGDDRIAFIVSHDECPNLLRHWQQRGVLRPMLHNARLGLWFAGGHRDWDGREHRALIESAAPLLFLRTQQSSPALLDGAAGVSHYRVVDLVEGRAVLPHDAAARTGPPGSFAAGGLSATIHGPNDGTQSRLTFSAVNRLPFRMDRLALRLFLRRTDDQPPWCVGGRLEQLTKLETLWECRVAFDLPDKGALQGIIGTGPRPSLPKVAVEFDAPAQPVRFKKQQTPEGLSYLALSQGVVSIVLTNESSEPAVVTPHVRLDGNPIAYRRRDRDGPFVAAYRLRLAPGETTTLQLDLSAVRVLPGQRELQVYLKDAPAWTPACGPLTITAEP